MNVENFGRNVRFSPKELRTPKSEEELLKILAESVGRNVRVVGRLHSWSEILTASDLLLDLRELNSVEVEQRDDGPWAILAAGCQIKHALEVLEREHGLTLPAVGLIDEQSIAGAIATGTHGSGAHSLSHYVDEIRIARFDESGKPAVVTITSGAELEAARCSLGCLGVVLSVGVRCRPQYRIEQHFRSYPDLPSVLAAEEKYPLQQFYLEPYRWKFLAQHRKETEGKKSLLAGLFHTYWFLLVDVLLHLGLKAKLASGVRGLLKFYYRYVVPSLLIKGWRVTDRSQRMLTMGHDLFRHVEMELFVPGSKLGEMLDFSKALIRHAYGEQGALDRATLESIGMAFHLEKALKLRGKYAHNYPICVRKVLPDDTMVSPAAGGGKPWYAVSFITYESPDKLEGFREFSDLLASATAKLYGARPHWGKRCPLGSDLLEQVYPRMPEFRQQCRTADPNGAFRNAWAEEKLGLGVDA